YGQGKKPRLERFSLPLPKVPEPRCLCNRTQIMGKRILFVSSTPTHPPNAGNRVRFRRLMDELAALGHEIHLLVTAREQADPEAMKAWLGDRFHFIPYHRPRRGENLVARLMRWAKQVVDHDARYLWRIDDWYDPALDEAIDRLHAEHRFEAVVVVY